MRMGRASVGAAPMGPADVEDVLGSCTAYRYRTSSAPFISGDRGGVGGGRTEGRRKLGKMEIPKCCRNAR